MSIFKWLQLFADGAAGDGGDGAGSGVSAADPGQQNSLESLGVPPEKAERFRRRKANRSEVQPQQTAESAVEENTEPVQEQAPMSIKDFIKANPEANKELQGMFQERVGKSAAQQKALQDRLDSISPMMELLAAKYGIEAKDGVFDFKAISDAVSNDTSYYEDKALELGTDEETAMRISQLERENARAQRMREAQEAAEREAREKEQRDLQLREHFMSMQQQANVLKETVPGFDLQRELQNPEFFKRTSPEVGMSVEDAFYSLHHGEMMQAQASAIAQRAKLDVSNSIRAGKTHPRENGTSASAPVNATPNLKAMSHADRLNYIKNKYPTG